MTDFHIRTEGRSGRITLTRPKALNALSYAMCRAIEDALLTWRRDPEINLGLRIGSFVRLSRNGSGYRQYICEHERPDHHTSHIHYSHTQRGSQVSRVVIV